MQLVDAAGNTTRILNHQASFANHIAGVPTGARIGPGSSAAARGSANGVNASDQAEADRAVDEHGEAAAHESLRGSQPEHRASEDRFKFPGPITYRFRVLSRYEADFPFLGGTSNVVYVPEH